MSDNKRNNLPGSHRLLEMPYTELIAYADEVQGALRRKMYAEGFEEGRNQVRGERTYHRENDAEELLDKWKKPDMSPQEQRDEIVERAKEDVQSTKHGNGFYKFEYVVNKEKRTIVALKKDVLYGVVIDKGIAKCALDDCFNTHIGRSIALRRALRMVVPYEYTTVPQPTEVRDGDIISFYDEELEVYGNPEGPDSGDYVNTCLNGSQAAHEGIIIDDSREDV